MGYLITVTAVAAAALLACAPLPWYHPAIAVVVAAAAAGYLLTAYDGNDLEALSPPAEEPAPATQRLLDHARAYRTGGTRAIEQRLRLADNPLEELGLRLLSRGADQLELSLALQRRGAELDEREQLGVRLLQEAGRGAVWGGVVVSLILLTGALTVVPTADSHTAFAGAFGGGIDGLILGWLILAPVAQRRARRLKRASAARAVWCEGLVAVAGGVHPARLADQLAMPERPLGRRAA